MNLFFVSKASVSLKKELAVILITLLFLIVMPMAAVMTLTRSDSVSAAQSVYNASSYPGDEYAWGNCTWWVFIRRSQIGEPIPNNWGNATTWASRAAADGYLVDQTPSYGAIMQISDVDNGLGHVAFVESVSPDGSWSISEMNVKGLDVIDYKTLSAADADSYNFIHNPLSL